MVGLIDKAVDDWTSAEVKDYLHKTKEPAIKLFEKAFSLSRNDLDHAIDYIAEWFENNGIDPQSARWPGFGTLRVNAERELRTGRYSDSWFRVDRFGGRKVDNRPIWLDDELENSGIWSYPRPPARKPLSVYQAFLHCAWARHVRKSKKQQGEEVQVIVERAADTKSERPQNEPPVVERDPGNPRMPSAHKVKRWLESSSPPEEQTNDDTGQRTPPESPPLAWQDFPTPSRTPFLRCVIYFGDLIVAKDNRTVTINVKPILMADLFHKINQMRFDKVEPLLQLQARKKKVYHIHESRGIVTHETLRQLQSEVAYVWHRLDTYKSPFKLIMYLAKHEQIVKDIPPELRDLDSGLSFRLTDETAAVLELQQ